MVSITRRSTAAFAFSSFRPSALIGDGDLGCGVVGGVLQGNMVFRAEPGAIENGPSDIALQHLAELLHGHPAADPVADIGLRMALTTRPSICDRERGRLTERRACVITS